MHREKVAGPVIHEARLTSLCCKSDCLNELHDLWSQDVGGETRFLDWLCKQTEETVRDKFRALASEVEDGS